MSFLTLRSGELSWLTSSLLSGASGITHGFSTRCGGVSVSPWDTLNLGVGRGDDPSAVEENYRRFCNAVHTDITRTVLSKQVHEDTVRIITNADAGKGLFRKRDYTADALITGEPGLALTVFSADCGILLLHDPVTGCIGACHAGWRGCALGIVEKTVGELHRVFGAKPENLLAAVGPAIGPCCFETDRDVPEAMLAALGGDAEPFLHASGGGKWHVDLPGLNVLWLRRAGVPAQQIDLCTLCTACHPELFWSHRKMGAARGAQIAMIALSSHL